ncbi:hypothetical protein [Robbsia andropogonis]|uniref:hypothetical protein n=1 Tax=Robbsia andropogonis TaxID=28092 RepID=UPI00138DE7FC|nr:hypothetical protein [Robbsia andropogonis]
MNADFGSAISVWTPATFKTSATARPGFHMIALSLLTAPTTVTKDGIGDTYSSPHFLEADPKSHAHSSPIRAILAHSVSTSGAVQSERLAVLQVSLPKLCYYR